MTEIFHRVLGPSLHPGVATVIVESKPVIVEAVVADHWRSVQRDQG